MKTTLAIFAALALTACAQVADYTGITPEAQLCIAMQAGNANAIEAILAAGIECLVPVAQ